MADEEKTEEPTEKRRSEARKKGNIAKSNDLSQAVTLIFGLLALSASANMIWQGLKRIQIESFRAIPDWRPTIDGLHSYAFPGFLFMAKLIAPVGLSIMFAGLLLGAFVTKLLFTTEVLTPDLAKVFNPASLARFVSSETWVNLLRDSLKMALIGIIGLLTVWPERGSFLEMATWPLAVQVSFTAALAYEAMMKMALVLLVIGIADYFWRIYKNTEDLKMSVQEVKDEARQSDGDPHVKGKIKQMRRAMYRRFMMREVPNATVVVTNPTHYAVALRYRQGEDRAPIVVAKGADLMAARIRELAREGGVPIVENPPLARALHAQVEPGDEIPGDLFAAVAELLAAVMGLGKGRPVQNVVPRAAFGLFPLILLFLGSCSVFDSPPEKVPTAQLRLSDGSGVYRGGDVVVRAHLDRCGSDPTRLTWATGRAVLLSRGQVRDADSQVVMDSLVLRWDSLPQSKDSTQPFQDTIALFLDGTQMGAMVLPLRNILPRLDSVQAGRALDSSSVRTLPLRGDTVLVAVHPGEFAYLRFRTTDPDRNYPAQWRLGLPLVFANGGRLDRRSGDPGDSILLWRSPSNIFDTTVACTLVDAQGQGMRRWLLRLSTYEERGSVWAGVHSELAKFGISQGGRLVEVARLSGFRDISALDVDPSREGGTLLVGDHVAGNLRKFTSEGMARTLSATVRRPRALACDADAGFCWAGDVDSTGGGRLARVDGGGQILSGFPSGITSVVVEQGAAQRAWFASSDSGFLGRTTGGRIDSLLRGRYRRIRSISWDDSTRLLWLVDEASGILCALDSAFREVRRITGLQQPMSVSASGGRVWVAETGAGAIRLYAPSGTLLRTLQGFAGPQAVAVVPQDPDRAWVADTENGRLVLVGRDSILASTAGQGMGRPNILSVHRGAP